MLRLLALALTLPALAQDDPVHYEDFDDGAVHEAPAGWGFAGNGYAAQVVPDGGSGQCVSLQTIEKSFGNMFRPIPLDELRGERIRFSASVVVQGPGRAQLWLRFDYEDGTSVLADNMHERPIEEGEWETHALVADVEDKPGSCVIGMMLFEPGTDAWIDHVRVEALGPTPRGADEGPRALDERGRANVTAFARLLGYVRYFHPSDEAAEADWDAFAVRGVRRVEGAADAAELAAALRELFAPVAPTVQVLAQGDGVSSPAALYPPATDERVSVRVWNHNGLGLHDGGPYRSWRSKKRVRDGELPAGVPDPAEPLELALPGGLVCRVPRALWCTRDGTLPAATPGAPEPDALPAPTGRLQSNFRGDDRSTRLAAVVLGWNVFQHFYPYFDEVEADWHAELARALDAAATDADGAAFLVTLRRMVAALQDGHGGVYSLAQTPVGTLPLLWRHVDGQLVVTAVVGDFEEDARVGDRVLEIGGVEAGAALRAKEELASGATPQWRRHVALTELLVGPYHTSTELLLERDGVERRVRLPFEWYDPPASEPLPETTAELEDGLWYIDLDRVTTAEFTRLLPSLQEADGIVFDLRGYPSQLDAFQLFPHIIDDTVHSAWWKVPQVGGPDGADREWSDSRWTIQPREPRLTARLAFLTGGGAISYAESCMAIVEEYELGEIVGGPTAGTNGNVNPFTLPGGYQVSWTGMKVRKHDGSRHHGVGIHPTIPVARTRAGVIAGRDEVLEAGLAAVRGK